jgi:hypothetical protein
MTRIGVTGHQHLGDEPTAAWVHTALNRVLGEHAGELVGVSSLAMGADQMFAGLVLERRGQLEVVLPFPEYRESFTPDGHNRRLYDRLIGQAQIDVLAREGRSDEEAYLHAGREVVSRCDVLVAVWNGAPARGLGGTADVVSYAREQDRAMVIIDPVLRRVTRARNAATPARAARLSNQDLDAARNIGDPLVDPILAEHLATHGPRTLGAITSALFRMNGMPEDHPLVGAYLAGLGEVDVGDPEIIARGQRLFALFGPEIFLVLGSCSLPLAFAAGSGVQAVFRARRLKDDSVRRLYDTAQMVINVMQIGGLAPGGVGWRTARKVRLIHALMRLHVQRDPASPWSETWGTPINQEDMAGTLLSFSVAVLHGLKRMGAKIDAEDADGYVYAWSAIGRLLGIDEALLAGSEKEALILAERIGVRQIRPTPEGRLLAGQLVKTIGTLFPLPGYANSLTHFFLKDTAFGENVAQVLDLPRPGWTKLLVAVRAWQKRKILAFLHVVPGACRRRSFLARRFVQNMIRLKRPGHDAPFEVPEGFAKSWRVRRGRVGAGERPSVDDSRREGMP